MQMMRMSITVAPVGGGDALLTYTWAGGTFTQLVTGPNAAAVLAAFPPT